MQKYAGFINVYFIFFLGVLVYPPFLANAELSTPARAVSESRYSKAHSLGDRYQFDTRDGWQTLNVTNMQHARRRTLSEAEKLDSRTKETKPTAKKSAEKASLIQPINDLVHKVFNGLKGYGDPEPVTITWYTGDDLKNPSCWSNTNWAPTDQSFACALTLQGWTHRPRCFKFLELCNGPKKCVFVRVVDSCAGCAIGSKHVDLTRAAFEQLANLEVGLLTVQFRYATEPDTWHEHLWGPKVEK